jgi:hypothetical protein
MIALVPSPMLGSAVWVPVAEVLEQRGHDVLVVPGTPAAPRSSRDVLDGMLAGIPEDRDVVLVPHSGAGLYVPLVAARRRLRAVVFCDAGVPPQAGSVLVAPPYLRDSLLAKADSAGLLPPWSLWWDEDLSALFPDPQARAEVEAQQHRLPMAYLADELPVPAGWDRVRCAYLGFGDTYAEAQAEAARRGWPVRVIDGLHLHMLVAPQAVADALEELLAATGAGD